MIILLLMLALSGCASTMNIESIDCEPNAKTKCYSVSMELLEAYTITYDDRKRLREALKICREKL